MKKNEKKATAAAVAEKNGARSIGFLRVFVCAFLALVLVFGSTLLIILGVRNSRAAVSYGGVTMDKKVASYFAAEYKSAYLASLAPTVPEACDAPIFWEMKSESGKSYGELLSEGVREYLAEILVANYLFERYSEYTAEDKERVDKAIEELLDYRAGGSVEEFNKLTSPHGFDYDAFKRAVMMSYKTSLCKSVIYGSDGSKISYDGAACLEYLNTYSHVYMFLIRTETKDIYDENGKYVDTVPLSDTERAAKLEKINQIRAYINPESDSDVEMSPALFKSEAVAHDEFNKDMQTLGYYFNKNAAYTQGFALEWYSSLPEAAYEMNVGEYREVSCDLGVWFIYKDAISPDAYTDSALEDCFVDFYSDAAIYTFAKTLSTLSSDASFTDVFDELDLINLPYTTYFTPSFS